MLKPFTRCKLAVKGVRRKGNERLRTILREDSSENQI